VLEINGSHPSAPDPPCGLLGRLNPFCRYVTEQSELLILQRAIEGTYYL
jgi:hypothetical protein